MAAVTVAVTEMAAKNGSRMLSRKCLKRLRSGKYEPKGSVICV